MDDEIKIDLKDINEKLQKNLKDGKDEEIPNLDPKFMSFSKQRDVCFGFSVFEVICIFIFRELHMNEVIYLLGNLR